MPVLVWDMRGLKSGGGGSAVSDPGGRANRQRKKRARGRKAIVEVV